MEYMKQLHYKKEGKKWICYDDFGNEASGNTVNIAKNNYNLIYNINKIEPVGIDINKIMAQIKH